MTINRVPFSNEQASSLADGTDWKCLKVIQLSDWSHKAGPTVIGMIYNDTNANLPQVIVDRLTQ
jgi:hypothetical protein